MASYTEAAYLTSLFLTHPQADWGAIHFAIWGLFDPAVSSTSGYTADAAACANQAATLYTGGEITLAQVAGYRVLTANVIPPDGRGPQEFLSFRHRNPVRCSSSRRVWSFLSTAGGAGSGQRSGATLTTTGRINVSNWEGQSPRL